MNSAAPWAPTFSKLLHLEYLYLNFFLYPCHSFCLNMQFNIWDQPWRNLTKQAKPRQSTALKKSSYGSCSTLPWVAPRQRPSQAPGSGSGDGLVHNIHAGKTPHSIWRRTTQASCILLYIQNRCSTENVQYETFSKKYFCLWWQTWINHQSMLASKAAFRGCYVCLANTEVPI